MNVTPHRQNVNRRKDLKSVEWQEISWQNWTQHVCKTTTKTAIVLIEIEFWHIFTKMTFTVVHIWTWQQSPWLCGWERWMDGACRFSADIHGPLRMIPNNFSDLLTPPLAPTWPSFCMKRQNMYWMDWHEIWADIHVPHRMNFNTFRGVEMSRCGRGLIKSKMRFIPLLVLNDEEISMWRNMDKLIIPYIVIKSRSLNQ